MQQSGGEKGAACPCSSELPTLLKRQISRQLQHLIHTRGGAGHGTPPHSTPRLVLLLRGTWASHCPFG